MIAAAHADGEVDADERQRIFGRLEQSGLDP
ncbi:dihydroorotase, partial [Candidatus Endoriftia persephone str. Guaymas]|nr:dihydroorotase [Candidatus Endoriftia persephone str. Guaymas]